MAEVRTVNAQRILLQRVVLLAVIWVYVISLCALSNQIFYLNLLLATAPFLGLLCYAYMHEHYHTGSLLYRKKHDWLGVAYAALLGFNWVLYRIYHGNHHRYGNAKGDYSCTNDDAGQPVVGWKYLLQKAVIPYCYGLVPYLSVLSCKPEKRSALLWIDESCRVGLRLLLLVLWGTPALFALLSWQFIFMNFLLFFNYLQHFRAEDGHGVVWHAKLLNLVFLNGGLHDQHHMNPAWRGDELPFNEARVSVRERVGLFNPVVFAIFLVSPAKLAKVLRVVA